MKVEEFEKFLEEHQHIEWQFDEEHDQILFRDINLLWYQEDPTNCTAITRAKFVSLTPDELLNAIQQGLQVEQMTRVTGYFSKVKMWNPGKLQELKDRHRTVIE